MTSSNAGRYSLCSLTLTHTTLCLQFVCVDVILRKEFGTAVCSFREYMKLEIHETELLFDEILLDLVFSVFIFTSNLKWGLLPKTWWLSKPSLY